MVIYEVNLEIEPEIRLKYLEWLNDHVADILKLPGFQSAKLYQRESETDSVSLTVHYILDSRESLEKYLALHAPKFRQDAIDRFSTRFKASRRVLEEMKQF
jgi:antibiotic biosynthesis monooxygenase (ABM) superfamily enzyme